jgi:hypothetical protein
MDDFLHAVALVPWRDSNLEVNEQILYARMIDVEQTTLIE